MSSDAIPLSAPSIGGNAWTYVKDCLDTGWVSSAGTYVDGFQRRFAEHLGVTDAVATASGTAALHLALLAVGVRPGDEVITSDLTFIAPANAIRYCAATPVFIDAEPRHWQMDVARLAGFLDRVAVMRGGRLVNRETGRAIAALLPVHILGHPCDLEGLLALAARYDLPVVEDATESLGSAYRGRPVGTLGTVGCFSFNGNKLMTTGAGGMLVSSDAVLARSARHLGTTARTGDDNFIHDRVGYNYRMSNLHAALGVAQLEQLDRHVAAKARIAALYDEAFGGRADTELQPVADGVDRCFWMYTVRLPGRDARGLMGHLRAKSIESRPLWQPMHRSPAHEGAPRVGGDVADTLVRECLSLPCSVDLSEHQQARVIDECRAYLTR